MINNAGERNSHQSQKPRRLEKLSSIRTNMSTAIAVNERRRNRLTLASRGANPPRPTPARAARFTGLAADREQDVLPAFAPLLEELELAGWSSQWRMLGGHFHDWMLLDRRRVLVMVGQAAATELADPMETALMAQAARASRSAPRATRRRRRPAPLARRPDIAIACRNAPPSFGRGGARRCGRRFDKFSRRGQLPCLARAGCQVRATP